MEPRWLDELKGWFADFTNRFFCQDEYVNLHLRLKQEHTARTREQILYLAERLGLDENKTRVAETIALLHDVGRFPQFARYRTYNDTRSVNHCCLGVEVLHQEKVLESLPPQEKQWIRTAVAHHGRKALPADLDDDTLLFLKMIRDADKLDIFRIVADIYRLHKRDPKSLSFELELPDEPRMSPEVVDAVLNGRLIEYGSLRTLNDIRLCQIGWVYDLNFAASVERFDAGNYLDELFSYLPQTPDIVEARRRIRRYMDERVTRKP